MSSDTTSCRYFSILDKAPPNENDAVSSPINILEYEIGGRVTCACDVWDTWHATVYPLIRTFSFHELCAELSYV